MFNKNKTVSLPVQTQQSPAAAAPWYAAGLRFTCTQCGNCCSGAPGYVWTTPEDWARIAAFLALPLEEFTRRYIRAVSGVGGHPGVRYSLIEQPNNDCIFLRREAGKSMCSIYPVRPIQCSTWPFWNQNLESPKTWAAAAHTCPGMKDPQATLYSLPIIEERRTATVEV